MGLQVMATEEVTAAGLCTVGWRLHLSRVDNMWVQALGPWQFQWHIQQDKTLRSFFLLYYCASTCGLEAHGFFFFQRGKGEFWVDGWAFGGISRGL